MKKIISFFPLMMVSLLVGCGQQSSKIETFTFSFKGTNCTINAHEEYHDEVIKNQENIEYTIVPDDGCLLPVSLTEQPSGVTYNKDNGVVTINKMSSDFSIKATADPDSSHHVVNFETFGVGDVHNQIVEDSGTAFEPVAPARTGYNFNGWYDNEDFIGAPYDFSTLVTSNITLYANYVKKTFVVTFYDEDGTTIVDQQNDVPWGTKPASLVIPHKDNTPEYEYEFDRWEPEITDDTTVTSNMSFTATYAKTKRQYKVTWIKYDGIVCKETTEDYGATPIPPEDPTREGTDRIKYTFNGWDKEITTVDGDQVYTAKWIETKKYEIRFVNYDYTPIGDVQYVAEKENPVVPESPTRSPDAKYTYTFKNWGVDKIPAATKDVIYQAQFTKTINKYAVSFILGDKGIMYESDQQQIEYGSNPAKPKRDPYRPGYRFLGWYNENETVPYDFNNIITGNTKIVAKWEEDTAFSEPFYVENADTTNSMVVPNSWKYKLSQADSWLDGDGSSVTFTNKLYLGRDSTASIAAGEAVAPTNKFNVGGNIMSLFDSDETSFKIEDTIPSNVNFEGLFTFEARFRIQDASKLLLPATNLTNNCYLRMFSYAESMSKTPALLPAKVLAISCYSYMFASCKSISNAPVLPFTRTASSCCGFMFYRSGIISTPDISQVYILSESCYRFMFAECLSLVNVCALPSTDLFLNCYGSMFSTCTSLKRAPYLPATDLVASCYANMFSNCSSLEVTTEEGSNIKIFKYTDYDSRSAIGMFSNTKGRSGGFEPTIGSTYYYVPQANTGGDL